MKNSLAALSLVAALTLPFNAAADTLALADLMRLFSATTTLTAQFTETRHVAILSKPLVVKGKLIYIKPAQLERLVFSPHEEKITVAGNQITIEKKSRSQKTVLSVTDHPALFAFIEGLRATLSGNQTGLEKIFNVTLDGSRQSWTLVLVPRDARLAEQIPEIRMEGSLAQLLRLEYRESDGSHAIIQLTPLPS